jgi:hypothetical protein
MKVLCEKMKKKTKRVADATEEKSNTKESARNPRLVSMV